MELMKIYLVSLVKVRMGVAKWLIPESNYAVVVVATDLVVFCF